MKLLFIGDIVGKSGRKAVEKQLSSLVKTHKIDLVLANAENAAHGKGITEKIYRELQSYGVDYMSLGNHAFSKDVIKNFIQDADRLIRPANMYPLEYGKGFLDFELKGLKFRFINLCGTVFMDNISQNPFLEFDKLKGDSSIIHIVDLHAEATSEKAAFLEMFKSNCALIVGTHTHVQTADDCIRDGCAFISDVGMTGPYYSIIGRDTQEVLNRFRGIVSKTFTVGEGEAIFCAVVVEINESTLRAESIERIQIRPN